MSLWLWLLIVWGGSALAVMAWAACDLLAETRAAHAALVAALAAPHHLTCGCDACERSAQAEALLAKECGCTWEVHHG